MVSFLPLILLIPAVALTVGDFRERRVHLLWLLALAAASFATAGIRSGFHVMVSDAIFNLLFLCFMGAGIGSWLCIRYRGSFKVRLLSVKRLFGAGDVVFLIALTPMFGLKEYIVFLLAACIISLVWWAAVRAIRHRSVAIPFIGTSGIVLCITVIIRVLL